MRKIIYRGQDIAGNWHYGVPLVFTDDYVCITAPHTYNKAVKPETVGQFTGLYDNTKWEDLSTEEQAEFLYPTNGGKRKKEEWKGKPIFEGDICKHRSNYSGEYIITVVTYTDGQFLAMADNNSGFNLSDKLEVIGNIHDNPELLGGDK